MLLVNEVSKRFGAQHVLRQVNLRCGNSELCAVMGQNGSGKSTLLRILAGIIPPDAGSVSVLGHDLESDALAARRHLGYAPDATEPLPALSAAEYVSLVSALKGVANNEHTAARIQQLRVRFGLDDAWSKRLDALSFGQRKRVCIIAALIGDPWLLVLDEPSNGLDSGAINTLSELLKERAASGAATLYVSNDPVFVRATATGVFHLQHGQLQTEKHSLVHPVGDALLSG